MATHFAPSGAQQAPLKLEWATSENTSRSLRDYYIYTDKEKKLKVKSDAAF